MAVVGTPTRLTGTMRGRDRAGGGGGDEHRDGSRTDDPGEGVKLPMNTRVVSGPAAEP